MDTILHLVPGIVLQCGSLYSAFCGHISYLAADGYDFAPAPEIDYSKIAATTATLDESESIISVIPAEAETFAGMLYDKLPFVDVEVLIYEIELDDSFAVTNSYCIWRGLLYQLRRWLNSRVIDVRCREIKYYYDKTAGVICTEQCSAAYFGDKICGKTVGSTTGVIDSITGSVVVLTAVPTGTDWIYHNGYMEYGGIQIKIAYWESGDTFNLVAVPPADWEGKTVTIYQGCDKTITSCRCWDNEDRFFGLGFSMVDYNAMTEEG